MFYLSSDMAERIRFDEWAFCHADECIRAAEIPVWQIDAEEFAREQIELMDGFDADDEEEAEARYIDAFRKAHRYALRSAVVDTAADLGFDELVGLAECDFPFERVTLLQMPSAESLAAIDEAAGYLSDKRRRPRRRSVARAGQPLQPRSARPRVRRRRAAGGWLRRRIPKRRMHRRTRERAARPGLGGPPRLVRLQR